MTGNVGAGRRRVIRQRSAQKNGGADEPRPHAQRGRGKACAPGGRRRRNRPGPQMFARKRGTRAEAAFRAVRKRRRVRCTFCRAASNAQRRRFRSTGRVRGAGSRGALPDSPPESGARQKSARACALFSRALLNYMPFFTSGPLGHWQMGMISTRLMWMCAGRWVTQNTVSAMSCGVMGLVPS